MADWGNDDDFENEELLTQCDQLASQVMMEAHQNEPQNVPPGQLTTFRIPESRSGATVTASSSGMGPSSSGTFRDILQELQTSKTEVERQKQEIQNMKKQQYEKEGETQILRDQLQKLQTDLTTARQVCMIGRGSQEYHELEQKLESTRTELQFKNQEVCKLQEKVHSYEQKMKTAAVKPASSGQAIAGKKRKVSHPETDMPPVSTLERGDGRGVFPSSRSFHFTTEITSGYSKLKPAMITEASTSTSTDLPQNAFQKNTETCLNECQGCTVLMSLLMPHPLALHGVLSIFDGSLYSVSSLASSVSRLVSSDGKYGSLRKLDFTSFMNESTFSSTSVKDGSSEAYRLAVRGLQILEEDSCRGVAKTLHSVYMSSQICHSLGALYLLPLIEQQLTNCANHIQNFLQTCSPAATSSSDSGGSSSLTKSSSLESGSPDMSNVSPVGGALLASSMEHSALAALHELAVLFDTSSHVSDWVLDGASSTSEDKANMEPEFARLPDMLTSCNVLIKLMQLAEPHFHGKELLFPRIVEAALSTLTILSHVALVDKIDRLTPILAGGTLCSCLNIDGHTEIIFQTVQLLTGLAASEAALTAMCNKSDTCSLHALYCCCINPTKSLDCAEFAQLVLEFLSSTLFSHCTAPNFLLHNGCQYCSPEIGQAVVLLLHRERYRESPSVSVLQLGLTVLSILCNHDADVQERFKYVGAEYRTLITACSRDTNLGSLPEINVLRELWEDDDATDSEPMSIP